jgi:hypothetical protein
MRRLILTLVALVAGGSVAPATHAATADSIRGGCGFYAEPTTGDSWSGLTYDVSATFDATGQPKAATVTCWLEVNGVEAPGSRHSYGDIGGGAGVGGVQAGAHSFAYNAQPEDIVVECTAVQWADGSSESECPAVTELEIPPQGVWDVFETVASAGRDTLCAGSVDACAAICPALASVDGTYGRLTIGPDGDVYLMTPFLPPYRRVLDCAPVGNPY